jgi:hypothetical protein
MVKKFPNSHETTRERKKERERERKKDRKKERKGKAVTLTLASVRKGPEHVLRL